MYVLAKNAFFKIILFICMTVSMKTEQVTIFLQHKLAS